MKKKHNKKTENKIKDKVDKNIIFRNIKSAIIDITNISCITKKSNVKLKGFTKIHMWQLKRKVNERNDLCYYYEEGQCMFHFKRTNLGIKKSIEFLRQYMYYNFKIREIKHLIAWYKEDNPLIVELNEKDVFCIAPIILD